MANVLWGDSFASHIETQPYNMSTKICPNAPFGKGFRALFGRFIQYYQDHEKPHLEFAVGQ
jgi:hypothetical protein